MQEIICRVFFLSYNSKKLFKKPVTRIHNNDYINWRAVNRINVFYEWRIKMLTVDFDKLNIFVKIIEELVKVNKYTLKNKVKTYSQAKISKNI